jgi:CheY-like chemotaxis protein
LGKTMLTIDDSKAVRMIVSKHMTPFGVKMLEAENGEQGLIRAREGAPDLILLDYNMPVKDGYNTLQELKADPVLKPIPVVMLTTETVQGTVINLMKMGLRDFIAKPFTREILLQKVNPILNLFEGKDVPPLPENPASAASPARTIEPNNGKPTILAIDDKENILRILKEHIGEGFQIITADSGKAALAVILQHPFDFMFLDLSLPDISAFDVYDAYIKSGKNGASPKKVVFMPLRTAQADIEKAHAYGVQLLNKPFSSEDVALVLGLLIIEKEKGSSNKTTYLSAEGSIRILTCPLEKTPKFRIFAAALTTTIRGEIDAMAEEGLTKLVIEMNEGFLSDISVTRKFIDLVDHACTLSMSIRFVAESQSVREALKQFAETASIPMDISKACAINSMG